MDFLEDLKMSLLNFNFVMIYIIRIILVLPKNHLNYLEDSIFEWFFKEHNRLFLKKRQLFSQHIMIESLSLEEENIAKDIKNLFRLKKQLNYPANKDINLFRIEKKIKELKINNQRY